MATEPLTSTEYIKHHLTNLTFGKFPEGHEHAGHWGFAHSAADAQAMGFWAINVDSMIFSIGQQKAYDLKADTIGTHRVVEVYTEAGNKVATIEDESMRFELVGERSVRLWLGDKNEKVMIGNMGFIITDK